MNAAVVLTADEAIEAARAAAFTIGEEYEGAGRVILHSFAGPFGADWDLSAVIAAIETARDVGWIDDIVRHDLAVITKDGRFIRFDVPRPERAR